MQTCFLESDSTELRKIHCGNKLESIGFSVGFIGPERKSPFLSYFPHPLLAALVENRGGAHEAVSGVRTVAAV